jgi:hypothetical protein
MVVASLFDKDRRRAGRDIFTTEQKDTREMPRTSGFCLKRKSVSRHGHKFKVYIYRDGLGNVYIGLNVSRRSKITEYNAKYHQILKTSTLRP